MEFGLGLSLLGSGRLNWTPAALARNSVAPFWGVLGGQYQDVGGLIPAVDVTDPVALLEDASGGGYDASQPVAAQQPEIAATVGEDGRTYRHLLFDGIDDGLSATLPDMGSDAVVWSAGLAGVTIEEGQTIGAGAYDLQPDKAVQGVKSGGISIANINTLLRYLKRYSPAKYATLKTRMDVICLNAVDVVIYDPSRDSDGGALALAAGVPGPAVIIAEAASVKIYHGSDPALPLYKSFDFTGHTVSSVAAGAQYLVVGTGSGVAKLDIAADTAVTITHSTATSPAIVSNDVNDVAITALSGAPIDGVTGLPVPTIAVATDAGVSVIMNNGTDAWDIYNADGTNFATSVAITPDGKIAAQLYDAGRGYRIFDMPAADVAQPNHYSRGAAVEWYERRDGSGDLRMITGTAQGAAASLSVQFSDSLMMSGSAYGLSLIARNQATPAEGMIANITDTYNTGWMAGEIKGAFLSSTDDSDLIGAGNLVVNGTFDTDIAGVNDGSDAGGSVAWNAGAQALDLINVTGNARASISVPVVLGKLYAVYVSNVGSGSISTYVDQVNQGTIGGGTADRVTYVVAVSNPMDVSVRNFDAGTTKTADNIRVELVDHDRSVNANPLTVSGTITRDPVADGAELMGYSNFDGTRYLEQSPNPDLDFGTGDFHVMGWMKGATSYDAMISYGDYVVDGTGWYFATRETANNLRISIDGDTFSVDDVLDPNVWELVAFTRKDGVGTLWANGVEVGTSGALTGTATVSADATLMIGARLNSSHAIGTNLFGGSLALWRLGSTAPTASQMAKIYADELPMFQPGAACTLAGSDAVVNALAHDPDLDLLHVGQSSGTSIFNGLARIEENTNAVTTTLDVMSGMVAGK